MNEKLKLIVQEAKKRPRQTIAWGVLILLIIILNCLKPGHGNHQKQIVDYKISLKDTAMVVNAVKMPAYQWELVKGKAKETGLEEGFVIGKVFENISDDKRVKDALEVI